MDVAGNLQNLKNNLPEEMCLVAVSKTKPEDIILEAYNAGHRVFGENKVQELVRKYENLPKDIEWHMIGHLQTNKIKYIAPFIRLIHSIDSMKLLSAVNKEAARNNRVIDCLFQLKIASEESKFGLSRESLENVLRSDEYKSMSNIRITGLMGMATYTDETGIIKNEFNYLSAVFNDIKNDYFRGVKYFKEKSMGMSEDYPLAIESGSTMIRIGSLIFGSRIYT